MRIGLVDVFVDDQDRAHDCYAATLGLQVKSDAPYGAGARWLTVVSPEDPGGTGLLLAPVEPPSGIHSWDRPMSAGVIRTSR